MQFSVIRRLVRNSSLLRQNLSGEGAKKIGPLDLQHLKRKGEKMAMITAYDYPSGKHAERAGFDIVLVGDSLGMVVLGYTTTQPVEMDDMIHHCKAVRRGAPTRFIVADMPFGSYEVNDDDALRNALRFIKEAGADAVKLEGGRLRVDTVKKLVGSGVAVMGHVGLTPQSFSINGFRAQGRTASKAREIVDDAIALQNAGAFAIVVECVPAIVAKEVSELLEIPVIGIGAGPHTSGQVLVYHDLLGIMHHPHHEKYVPKFCKQYASLGEIIHEALTNYRTEVLEGSFPSEEYSPYKMPAEEQHHFLNWVAKTKTDHTTLAGEVRKKLIQADESEIKKLY